MDKKSKEIHCDLCNIILPNDELAKIRMQRHSHFHQTARIQKRNWTQGTPKFRFF